MSWNDMVTWADLRGGGGAGQMHIYLFLGVQFWGTFLHRLSRPVNIKAGGGGCWRGGPLIYLIFFQGGGR